MSYLALRREPSGGRTAAAPRRRPVRSPASPGRFLQAKLQLGAVNDPLEREADAVADRVMRGGSADPSSGSVDPRSAAPIHGVQSHRSTVQRACSCAATDDEIIRRTGDRNLALSGAVHHDIAPGVGERIDARRHGGRPLPGSVRSLFESRMNSDFSGVRVHDDAAAFSLNHDLRAKALTVGTDIFFGRGQYRPLQPEGQRLLAHELVHTLQQGAAPRGGRGLVQRAEDDLRTVPAEEVAHPTPGRFYRVKPGDSLFGVAGAAFGVGAGQERLHHARAINQHPFNQRYHTPSSPGEKKLLGSTRISFAPRFACDQDPLAGPSIGKCFALLHIPDEAEQNKLGEEIRQKDGVVAIRHEETPADASHMQTDLPASQRRSNLLVENPTGKAEHLKKYGHPVRTNGELALGWLRRLSGAALDLRLSGGYVVDNSGKCPGSGLKPEDRETRRKSAEASFAELGKSVSAGCLCDLLMFGAYGAGKPLTIVVAEKDSHGEDVLWDRGGGVHLRSQGKVFVHGVAVAEEGVQGASTFKPKGQTGKPFITDEPWIILGHELCGHPRSKGLYHQSTAEGDRSALDIENAIRKEHGAGYRLGEMSVVDPRQPMRGGELGFIPVQGSMYALRSEDVGTGMADRLSARFGYPVTASRPKSGLGAYAKKVRADYPDQNIPADAPGAKVYSSLWRALDGQYGRLVFDSEPLKAGDELFVRDVFWHHVGDIESLWGVSWFWGVSVEDLAKVNPGVPAPDSQLKKGLVLLIPFAKRRV